MKITKIVMLKSIFVFAIAVAWLTLPLLSKPHPEDERPNIIYIMADDLGYGDLGSYGQEVIQTPHLDQMAREGIRFTQCYAGSPVCAPSRSVLLTGLHTGHTTVRGNFGKKGVVGLAGRPGRVPLRDEDITVAEVLKSAGYVTGITGKWGLGEPRTEGEPNVQGFDEWFGYLNQRRAHNYYPEYLFRNREGFLIPENEESQEQVYSHDLFTDFALGFIAGHSGSPFFLYLAYTIPHDEYEIPSTEPYADRNWSHEEKVHAAMVTRMDRDIGKIFELLGDLKIDEDTIVFFCSDNGAARRWEGRFDSSGELRGRKRDLYEGGIRTPMIVRWPGVIKANQVSDAIWSFADVLPTLAELAGAEAPAGIDGASVLPSLLGQKQNLKNRFLYWEFHERGFQQAARWMQWKAVRLEHRGPLELYDLKQDPRESRNIGADRPDLVELFENYLWTERSPSENWPVP